MRVELFGTWYSEPAMRLLHSFDVYEWKSRAKSVCRVLVPETERHTAFVKFFVTLDISHELSVEAVCTVSSYDYWF